MNDKTLHILAGFIIAVSVGVFISPAAGFAASVLAGAGKEVYDKFHPKHTADWLDFLATVAGGGLGAAVSVLAYTPPVL